MNFFKKFDKLHLKYKDNRNKIISTAITMAGIACLIIGSSFAYLIFQSEGETQTISAGTLALEFINESESITLQNAVPQSDEVAMNNTSYNFTLKNSGTISSYYEIRLNNDCTVGNSYNVDGKNVTADLCIPNQYIKVAIKVGNEDYKIVEYGEKGMIASGTLVSSATIPVNIIIWLSSDTPNDYQGIDKNVIYNGKISLFARQLIEEQIPNLDTSGANAPDLASNMIPVYYDSTNDVWRKADSTNANSTYRWYSYTSDNNDATKGMWANAVTVTETNRQIYMDADLGTVISMDDINTMFVWIPRFNAATPSNYNGGAAEAPGAIDVTFVDTNTPALDAFWWDEDSDGVEDSGEQKSGFWFGKFETSSDITCTATTRDALGSGCNLNTIKPMIKPNVTSWRGALLSTFFTTTRAMENTENIYGFDNTIDIHMLKNNEWGAAAYLTQSIYGRCTSGTSCTEVTKNSNSSYITGAGNYKTNINQTTTGTIYGIYDMNGGSYEGIMGNYSEYSGCDSDNSGFNGPLGRGGSVTNGIPFPESKYYNLYTGTSYTGHALTETSGWYNGGATFAYSLGPWFTRGGSAYNNGADAGLFTFSAFYGYANSYSTSRISIVK